MITSGSNISDVRYAGYRIYRISTRTSSVHEADPKHARSRLALDYVPSKSMKIS